MIVQAINRHLFNTNFFSAQCTAGLSLSLSNLFENNRASFQSIQRNFSASILQFSDVLVITVISLLAQSILFYGGRNRMLEDLLDGGYSTLAILLIQYYGMEESALELVAKKGDLKVLSYLSTLKSGESVESLYASVMLHDSEDCVLHLAARYGHLDLLKHLHAQGYDINLYDVIGRSAIYRASMAGHIEIVQWLLSDECLSQQQRFYHANVALVVAIENRQLALVKSLVKTEDFNLDEDIEFSSEFLHHPFVSQQLSCFNKHVDSQEYGLSPLNYAACSGDLELIKFLYEEGDLDLAAGDLYGIKPLHYAISSGNLDLVEWLLDQDGVDINCTSNTGISSISWAYFHNQIDMFFYLTNLEGIEISSDTYIQGLFLAAKLGDLQRLQEFYTREIRPADTVQLLYKAIEGGNLALVQWLIVNSPIPLAEHFFQDNLSPLQLAVYYGHLDIVVWLRSVPELSFDHSLRDGRTLTRLAVECNQLDILQQLLNQDSHRDLRPIFDLALSSDMYESTIWLLRQENVLPTMRTPDSDYDLLFLACSAGEMEALELYECTVPCSQEIIGEHLEELLYCLVENGHIEMLKYLLEKWEVNLLEIPYMLFHATQSGDVNLIRYLVEEQHLALNEGFHDREIILNCAIRNRHFNLVCYLLSREEIDVNAQDSTGMTPLHSAASHGYLDLVLLLSNQVGIDFNATDRIGATPFHTAAENGSVAVTQFLASIEAVNVSLLDDRGRSALLHAAETQQSEMVRYLSTLDGINVNQGDYRSNTALHIAARTGDHETLCTLLEAPDIDPNIRNTEGYGAIHIATRNGYSLTVNHLVNSQCDINLPGHNGVSALVISILQSNQDIFEALFNHSDIDLSYRDSNEETAQDVAVRTNSSLLRFFLPLS